LTRYLEILADWNRHTIYTIRHLTTVRWRSLLPIWRHELLAVLLQLLSLLHHSLWELVFVGSHVMCRDKSIAKCKSKWRSRKGSYPSLCLLSLLHGHHVLPHFLHLLMLQLAELEGRARRCTLLGRVRGLPRSG